MRIGHFIIVQIPADMTYRLFHLFLSEYKHEVSYVKNCRAGNDIFVIHGDDNLEILPFWYDFEEISYPCFR